MYAGSVTYELELDRSKFNSEWDRMEKEIANMKAISLSVDHRPLHDLNKHLTVKQNHIKDLNRMVIRVKTETRELDKLDRQLNRLQNQFVTVNVKYRLINNIPKPSGNFTREVKFAVEVSTRNANLELAHEIKEVVRETKEVVKAINNLKPGLLGKAFGLATGGISALAGGITQGVGINLTKNFTKGLERKIESELSAFIGSFELLGEGLGRSSAKTTRSVSKAFNSVYDFFLDLQTQVAAETAKDKKVRFNAEQYRQKADVRNRVKGFFPSLNLSPDEIREAQLAGINSRQKQKKQRRSQAEEGVFAARQLAFGQLEDARSEYNKTLLVVDRTKKIMSALDKEVTRRANAVKLIEKNLTTAETEGDSKEAIGQIKSSLTKARKKLKEVQDEFAEAFKFGQLELEKAGKQKGRVDRLSARARAIDSRFTAGENARVNTASILEDLTGKKINRSSIPEIIPDLGVRAKGAAGLYSVNTNRIRLDPALYNQLAKGIVTPELYRALAHELSHAFDLAFGQAEGIRARKQGKVLNPLTDISKEEFTSPIPGLNEPSLMNFVKMYPQGVRPIELNAEARARRALKNKFPDLFVMPEPKRKAEPEAVAVRAEIVKDTRTSAREIGNAIVEAKDAFVETITPVIRIARSGLNAVVGAGMPVIRGGYGIAKGAENLTLGALPFGHAAKGILQNTVLPAAAFGAATHFLPGGEMVAGGLSSFAHGAIDPVLGAAGQHLIGQAASHLGSVPLIGGQLTNLVASGVNGVTGFLGSGIAETGTAILGGKILMDATSGATKAVLNPANRQEIKALPQSTQQTQQKTELVIKRLGENITYVRETVQQMDRAFKGASDRLQLPSAKEIKALPPAKLQEEVTKAIAYRESIINSGANAIEEIDRLLADVSPKERLNSPLAGLKGRIQKVVNKAKNFQPTAKLKKMGVDPSVVDAIEVRAVAIEPAGKDTVRGFEKGIQNNLNSLKSVAKEIGETVLDAVEESLEIRSPSRQMFKRGVYAIEGFIWGAKSELREIKNLFTRKNLIGDEIRAFTLQETVGNVDTSSLKDANQFLDSLNAKASQARNAIERMISDAINSEQDFSDLKEIEKVLQSIVDTSEEKISQKAINLLDRKPTLFPDANLKGFDGKTLEGTSAEIAGINSLLLQANANALEADSALEAMANPTPLQALRMKLNEINPLIEKVLGFAVGGTAAIVGFGLITGLQNSLSELAPEAFRSALNMERLKLSLNFSTDNAETSLDRLKKQSDALGTSFVTSARNYQNFTASTLGTSLEFQKDSIFEGINLGLATRGASTDQQDRALLAISQLASKGRASLEELSGQLAESYPGALQIAARAMGLTTQEFIKMVESGSVLSEDLLPKLATQIKLESAGGLNAIDDTAFVRISRFQNQVEQLKIALGEPLLDVTKLGLPPVTAALDALVKNAEAVAIALVSIGITSGLAFLQVLKNIGATALAMKALGVTAKTTRGAIAEIGIGLGKGLLWTAGISAAIVAWKEVFNVINAGSEESKKNLQSIKEALQDIETKRSGKPKEEQSNGFSELFQGNRSFQNTATYFGFQYATTERPEGYSGEIPLIGKFTVPSIPLGGLAGATQETGNFLNAVQPEFDLSNIEQFQMKVSEIREQIKNLKIEEIVNSNDSQRVTEIRKRIAELNKEIQDATEDAFPNIGNVIAQIETSKDRAEQLKEIINSTDTEDFVRELAKADLSTTEAQIRILENFQKNYSEGVKENLRLYQRLTGEIRQSARVLSNIEFGASSRSLTNEIETQRAVLAGQIKPFEVDLTLREKNLSTLRSQIGSLRGELDKTQSSLQSALTDEINQRITDLMPELNGTDFRTALQRGQVSAQSIGDRLSDLGDNAPFEIAQVLELAKQQVDIRQQTLNIDKAIADAELEIQSIQRERARNLRIANLTERDVNRRIATIERRPFGGFIADRENALAEISKQEALLQEAYRKLKEGAEDPNSVRQEIDNTRLALAQSRAALRQLERQRQRDLRQSAIVRSNVNERIDTIRDLPFGGPVASARDALSEVRNQTRLLSEAYRKFNEEGRDPALTQEVDNARLSLEQAKASLTQQLVSARQAFADFERASVDFAISIEDYQISSAREVRSLQESYDDLFRSLNQSLNQAETELRQTERALAASRLRNRLESTLTIGIDSVSRQLSELFLSTQEELDAIENERDGLRSRPAEIQDQIAQLMRQIRGVQEQQFDAERNRLKQLRDFYFQQESLNKQWQEIQNNQIDTHKELNGVWGKILEDARKLGVNTKAIADKLAEGTPQNAIALTGRAPNNSGGTPNNPTVPSEQYRQGTPNQPRTLQRGDLIDYGNGQIFKYDPSPTYDPRTRTYRQTANADDIRHPTVTQQVLTSGSEGFDRELMRSGLYKYWEGFTREVLNPNLKIPTAGEIADYRSGRGGTLSATPSIDPVAGNYQGVLSNQPRANIPNLAPIPEFNPEEAERLANEIKITQERKLQLEIEKSQVDEANRRRGIIEQYERVIRQQEQAAAQARIAQRDTEDRVRDSIEQSKGYLTATERINRARRDGTREIQRQREELQGAIAERRDQVTDFDRNRESELARFIERLGNEKGRKAFDRVAATIDQSKAQIGILENLEKELGLREEIAGQIAAARTEEEIRSEVSDRLTSIQADLADRRSEFNPLATGGAPIRVRADYERRGAELNRFIQENGQFLSLDQIREMRDGLEEMRNIDLARAFVDANPVASGLRDIIRGAVTDFDNLGQTALNVLQSIASRLLDSGLNSLLGGLLGGLSGGFGSIFGGGASAAAAVFPGASFSLAPAGLSFFRDGGTVPNFDAGGTVYGLGVAVAKAMEREGSGAVPIVAHEGEELLSARNGDAQFYRRLKNSGMLDRLKRDDGIDTRVRNYSDGGTVGRGDSAGNSGRSTGGSQTVVNNYHFDYKITAPNYDSFRKGKHERNLNDRRRMGRL